MGDHKLRHLNILKSYDVLISNNCDMTYLIQR